MNEESNKLYDLKVDQATIRGSYPWSFTNTSFNEEAILVPPETPQNDVIHDKLVERTNATLPRIVKISVKSGSVNGYDNPSTGIDYEQTNI